MDTPPSTGDTPKNKQTNTNTSEEVSCDRSASEDFDLFWSAFPRKEDRAAAFKLFSSAIQSGEVEGKRLIAAAAAYARQKEGAEEKWLKMPSTWLRSKGWLDQNGEHPKAEFAVARHFPGPAELRQTLVKKLGENWVKSYLDPADWLAEGNVIITRTAYAESVIKREASAVLAEMGCALSPPRARQ